MTFTHHMPAQCAVDPVANLLRRALSRNRQISGLAAIVADMMAELHGREFCVDANHGAAPFIVVRLA